MGGGETNFSIIFSWEESSRIGWKKGEDSEGSWIKDTTTCRVVAARLRVNRTRVSLSLSTLFPSLSSANLPCRLSKFSYPVLVYSS